MWETAFPFAAARVPACKGLLVPLSWGGGGGSGLGARGTGSRLAIDVYKCVLAQKMLRTTVLQEGLEGLPTQDPSCSSCVC